MVCAASAMDCSMRCPELSIVVPFLNEEEALPIFQERFRGLSALPESWEVIFVSDGSSDRSVEIVEAWAARDRRVKLLVLTRNFGHQCAISAGLDFAQGGFVGIMDADLQDPPEVLLEMFHEAKKGNWDVVHSVRSQRAGGIAKRIAYKLFYSFYRLLAETPVDPDSGDFCVLSRRAATMLSGLPEKDRFVRGLRSWLGLRQKGIPTIRPERAAGKAKYSWGKLASLGVSGLTSFSKKPLRIATIGGLLLCAAASVLSCVYLALWALGSLHERVPGFTTLVLLVLTLNGLQFLLIGIVGEYVGRIFIEVKRRPAYLVDRTVNIRKLAQPTRRHAEE
jgi:glycosyltransferase involved in cell wall biosynthesis